MEDCNDDSSQCFEADYFNLSDIIAQPGHRAVLSAHGRVRGSLEVLCPPDFLVPNAALPLTGATRALKTVR
jgi:hypothetical protein